MSTEHEISSLRSAVQSLAREIRLIRQAMERISPPPPPEESEEKPKSPTVWIL